MLVKLREVDNLVVFFECMKTERIVFSNAVMVSVLRIDMVTEVGLCVVKGEVRKCVTN